MNKIERIGIYGGTFSPPHLGHLKAAETFLAEVNPDRLLVIPTFLPPHKAVSPADSPEHRLEMTRLCFSSLQNTEVSDIEIRRQGKSYTYDTLSALSKEDRELFFLCGTDMLLTLDKWHRFRDIFSLATAVLERRECDPVLDRRIREKIDFYRSEYGARILEIEISPLVLSSTDVRNAVASSAPRSRLLKMVPSAVADYIETHGLYREETNV